MSSQGPQALLSSQEQQERFQITFVAIVFCLCLVASAALPFITFALLGALTTALMLSLKHFKEAANLAYQPLNEPLDTPTKAIVMSVITVLGIFFLQLNPFSQVIIATAFGTGLAAFFIHECVLASQDALNAALKSACQNAQSEEVKSLIERGACVFAKDEAGLNAFNHATHQAIKETLQNAALRQVTTRQDVLTSCYDLMSDDIVQHWQHTYQKIKQCISSNTREHRAQFYEATSNLISAYDAPIRKVMTSFTQYLRDKLDAAFSRELPVAAQQDAVSANEESPAISTSASHAHLSQASRHLSSQRNANKSPSPRQPPELRSRKSRNTKR